MIRLSLISDSADRGTVGTQFIDDGGEQPPIQTKKAKKKTRGERKRKADSDVDKPQAAKKINEYSKTQTQGMWYWVENLLMIEIKRKMGTNTTCKWLGRGFDAYLFGFDFRQCS